MLVGPRRSLARVIDWLAFTAASVVSNTPIPIAFDPILLHFAKTHPGDQAWVAAVVGALGAGVGGMCEMAAFRVLRRQYTSFATAVHRAPSGPWTAMRPRTRILYSLWLRMAVPARGARQERPEPAEGLRGYQGSEPLGWFYPWTAAMALTPVPFTVVRVAAYLGHARPGLYGLAIVIGRLPRHAAIVFLASALTFPPWLVPLTVVLAFSPLLWMLGRRVLPTSPDSPPQPPSTVRTNLHRQSSDSSHCRTPCPRSSPRDRAA